MRVALVHLSRGVDASPISPVVDHLGLEMVAGALRASGHEPRQLDTCIQGLTFEQLLDEVQTFDPGLIGMAVNYANVEDAERLCRRLRAALPRGLLVAGGHYATFHPNRLLSPDLFHGVVYGEGEGPMVALVNAADRGTSASNFAGLGWRDGEHVRTAAPRAAPAWGELPAADRELLPALACFAEGTYKVAVEASRGCGHSCRFCSIAAVQRLSRDKGRRRNRSVGAVAEEIGRLFADFGVREYWFMDPDFVGGADQAPRVVKLARRLGKIPVDLRLELDTRAESVIPEIISPLADVGLRRVFVGVESFHQSILAALGKDGSVETNLHAVETLERYGVRPVLGTIIFHPRSTLQQLRCDHDALSGIGYERTQMLFRLKKYRGSDEASDTDSGGRGVTFGEDYGWEFVDPLLCSVWSLFDSARLILMDAVFGSLTQRFQAGDVNLDRFDKAADQTFHALGSCMDSILEWAEQTGTIWRATAPPEDVREEIMSLATQAAATAARHQGKEEPDLS